MDIVNTGYFNGVYIPHVTEIIFKHLENLQAVERFKNSLKNIKYDKEVTKGIIQKYKYRLMIAKLVKYRHIYYESDAPDFDDSDQNIYEDFLYIGNPVWNDIENDLFNPSDLKWNNTGNEL